MRYAQIRLETARRLRSPSLPATDDQTREAETSRRREVREPSPEEHARALLLRDREAAGYELDARDRLRWRLTLLRANLAKQGQTRA